MDSVAWAVSMKQWNIAFKLRDFYLAIARLPELGATECSVDAMHPGIWEQYTATLAGEAKSSDSGKNVTARGKVEKTPRKAIEKQETQNAARTCLLVRAELGTGAKARTVPEESPPGSEDPGGLSAAPPSPDQSAARPRRRAEPSPARQRQRCRRSGAFRAARPRSRRGALRAARLRSRRNPNPPAAPRRFPAGAPSGAAPSPAAEAPRDTPAAENPRGTPAAKKPRETAACRYVPPPPPVKSPLPEAQPRAERFWRGLAGEARDAEAAARESTAAWPRRRLQNGAGGRREGRGPGGPGAKTRTPRDFRGARAREKGAESGSGHRANQRLRRAPPPYKGETTPREGRGEPGGRERPHPRRVERARGRTKRRGAPEVPWHLTSAAEPGNNSAGPEEPAEADRNPKTKDTEPAQFKTKPNRVLSRTEKRSQYPLELREKRASRQGIRVPAPDTRGGGGGRARANPASSHRKRRPCRRVSKRRPDTGPRGSPSHESGEKAPGDVGDVLPLWQSGPPRGETMKATAAHHCYQPNLTLKTKLMRSYEFCSQDTLVDRPCDTHTPVPERDNGPPSHQTEPERPTAVRPRHVQCLCAILLMGFVAGGQADPGHYPHQPFRWVMQHLSSDKVFKEVTTANAPSFVFHIADLFPGQPKIRPSSPHIILMYISYWCPASNPGKRYCDYPGWGHCGYWGCETIVTDARPWADGWQPQEPNKFLQFTWAPFGCGDHTAQPGQRACVSYNMTVLQPDHPSWATGRTWTVVLKGPRRWVNVRIIRLQPPTPRPVGPNKIIRNVLRGKNTTHLKTLTPKATDTPTSLADTPQIGRMAESDPNPIFRMLEATFLTLNETKPNLTNPCWLCYDIKPPFYEGIALDTPFSYSSASAPHQCRWDTPRRGITLSQITGQGRCFGNATLAKQKGNFCTKVVKPNRKTSKWVIPSASGMWVCQRSGVSPCVFLDKFNDSTDFCVQVLIVPRVLYHSDEEIYHLLEEPNRLHKREIITGITIAMLLGLGAAGTATGVSAIATQQHGLSQLQMTIDEDLQRIEKSISYLEKSVSSLSEVVLQNRRGLDLLFMQQGGLCAALKEECCFYADHTGVVKDSMAELRDRLAQRKRDRETQQSWFESWFNQSPWLTTLISALVGPLAILLLAITIGPCLLNKLVSFVQARLERANILFVGHQQML